MSPPLHFYQKEAFHDLGPGDFEYASVAGSGQERYRKSGSSWHHSSDAAHSIDPLTRRSEAGTSAVPLPASSDMPKATKRKRPSTASSTNDNHGAHERQHTKEPPIERSKRKATRAIYPRRRALTACEVCRSRKSKCDNQRPQCGTCTVLDAPCVYRTSDTDLSSLDQASLLILERVNHAIRLIESQSSDTSLAPRYSSATLSAPYSIPENSGSYASPMESEPQQGQTTTRNPRSSSVHVLNWPVFEEQDEGQNSTPHAKEAYESQTPKSHNPQPGCFRRDAIPGRGVHEEDVCALIQGFLMNVHGKNPILDPGALKYMARRISTEGFGWDEASCLVLIACAVANLAEPFRFLQIQKHEASHLDAHNYGTAEKYYVAAQKRIGLVNISIVGIQCRYLMAVYEMYTFQPLKAWLSFTQACNMFSAHTLTSSIEESHGGSTRRLEQILYWTCVKSEYEMRDEMELPASCLSRTEFPDSFPSPPGGTPAPDVSGEDSQRPQTLDTISQQSWLYYLSEIACRRLLRRIDDAFYLEERDKWNQRHLKQMKRIAHELDLQIKGWSEHVPFSVELEHDDTLDEYTWVTKLRFLQLQERLYRPFLFMLVHQEGPIDEQDVVVDYAWRCLDSAIAATKYYEIKHRHLGGWQTMRMTFIYALDILAAAKSRKITLPPYWRVHVERAMTTLSYWETEANDLQAARFALQRILAEIDVEDSRRPLTQSQ